MSADTTKSVILPEKYLAMFEDILSKLQTETGEMYQLHINKFDDMSGGLIIGAFKDIVRPIIIYDMQPGYEELNGTYASVSEAKKHVKELAARERFEETKTIIMNDEEVQLGKCKHCHSYGENHLHKSSNHTYFDICQNCLMHFSSKWDDMEVSVSTSEVTKYSGQAARYTFYDPVGKYTWQI